MEKIKVEDIPDALIKWADDTEDFWIIRFVRSLGYSLDDIVKLSIKNKKIRNALIIVSDSLYEKAAYKVAEGYLKLDLARSVYDNFKKRLKPLVKDRLIIDLCLDKDINKRFKHN
jgi:hypothetical protein